jgi:hypothetical protein
MMQSLSRTPTRVLFLGSALHLLKPTKNNESVGAPNPGGGREGSLGGGKNRGWERVVLTKVLVNKTKQPPDRCLTVRFGGHAELRLEQSDKSTVNPDT